MKLKYQLILLSLIIGMLVLMGGLFLDLSQPMAASDQSSPDSSLVMDQSQEIVIKFYYDNQQQLNEVAGVLDIWEIQRVPGIGSNSGYAVAAVNPAQKEWLEGLGYRVEINAEKTAELQSPAAVLDPRYYYYDNYNSNTNNLYMVNFMHSISDTYPALTELIDIGDAWLASHGGYHRDIWVLRISSEDPAYGDIDAKPPFFLFANVHAREVTTPEMAIRYIKYLTSGYNGTGGYVDDPDVRWQVNHHVVYVLVSQNPDGRAINEADTNQYRRKNVDNLNGCNLQDYWGTDLNRNSSFKWGCCGGSSGDPCSETYRGPSRASEPETAAFQTFASQVFTDWNGNNGDAEIPQASPDNAAGIFISLHSYSDDILWPWGFGGNAPNNAQLTTIGRKLADLTGYYPLKFLYTVDGSNDDWVYGKLGVASFTYEIGPSSGSCGDFFPAYGCQDGIDGMPRNFWAETKPSFIYANKIAGSPYKTSYGPDTKNLAVNPPDVPGGTLVNLTGTVLDQRYTGDPLTPIAAAEYFLDAPGADGSGSAMSPSDGAWGGTSKNVKAVVDTRGLSAGQHYILVHGKNNQGIWGPFTAVFLTISEPFIPFAEFTSNSPVQLGQAIQFTNLTTGTLPLSYDWDFGDGTGTSTETNPTYTYGTLGTYTVTLTASDAVNLDTITHTVTVLPVGITSVELTQVTEGPILPGLSVDFSADLLPDDEGKPYTYTIDFGDGTIITDTSSLDPILFTHAFSTSGWHTIYFSVGNAGMTDPVTDVLDVFVLYRNLVPIIVK